MSRSAVILTDPMTVWKCGGNALHTFKAAKVQGSGDLNVDTVDLVAMFSAATVSMTTAMQPSKAPMRYWKGFGPELLPPRPLWVTETRKLNSPKR